MRNFTEEEFVGWTKGDKIDNIHFVILKTTGCGKCDALIGKADSVFGNMANNIAKFNFKPGNGISNILRSLNILGVPVIVTRYSENGTWSLGKLAVDIDDDYIMITNTFDAINDNDQSFFGFNEWDELVEHDADPIMNRVLRSIYGEVDPNILKERKLLKREVTS